MKKYYCEHCERDVLARRLLGLWTYVLILATSGGWIFAILFYPKRCPICGNKIRGQIL